MKNKILLRCCKKKRVISECFPGSQKHILEIELLTYADCSYFCKSADSFLHKLKTSELNLDGMEATIHSGSSQMLHNRT